MAALFDVVLPVFLVLGAGYLARWRGLFGDEPAEALMNFTQRFAVPCLLFSAIARIDLSANVDTGLLASFYAGVAVAFAFGALGARWLFARPPEDCVALGFTAFFSNTVLLGLPIMERAYGSAALAPNYAIIAFHAPLLYAFGIVTMEIVRGRGGRMGLGFAAGVLRAIFSNALVIGILLGFAVNLGGILLPGPLTAAVEMLARSALPVALFALGAILFRYRPEGDMRAIAWVILASLIVHPAVTWLLASRVFDLAPGQLRAAVVTAAMAPGMNTYVFANMYGVGKRVAASAVLVGTAVSIVTVWGWLTLLP